MIEKPEFWLINNIAHPLPGPPPLRASPCSQLCFSDPSVGETKLSGYALCGSDSSVSLRLAR